MVLLPFSKSSCQPHWPPTHPLLLWPSCESPNAILIFALSSHKSQVFLCTKNQALDAKLLKWDNQFYHVVNNCPKHILCRVQSPLWKEQERSQAYISTAYLHSVKEWCGVWAGSWCVCVCVWGVENKERQKWGRLWAQTLGPLVGLSLPPGPGSRGHWHLGCFRATVIPEPKPQAGLSFGNGGLRAICQRPIVVVKGCFMRTTLEQLC